MFFIEKKNHLFVHCFHPVQAEDGFQVEMVLRFQCKDLSWTWLYIRTSKDSGCQGLTCTNFIIRYDKRQSSS